jgi:Tol biopolymer transport system component
VRCIRPCPIISGVRIPGRVAVVLAFAVALAVGSEPGSAVRPGANGKVAFASARDRNFEIYSVYPDGSGAERLTRSPAADADPAWSPEGRRIAFTSNRAGNDDIWLMAENGSGPVQLTTDQSSDVHATWSPGGRNLAFAGSRDGDAEIFVMNEDGTGQSQLTHNSSADATPAWSPDGARLAFLSERDGNSEIYVMNVDGSGATRLTDAPGRDVSPSWSPDGSRIAFASERDGTFEIYVMNADGSGQTRLTRNTETELDPAWSPDGRSITFTSNRDGNNEIYVMSADGSAQTRLTTSSAEDATSDWQWRLDALPPPLPVTSASFSGRWNESVFMGAVVAVGRVPQQVRLRFALRRGGRVLAARTLTLGRGGFRIPIGVPRTVLPGRFELEVRQAAGAAVVRPQRLRVRLVAPPEGVVVRAWASTTIGGPPRTTMVRTSDAFAHFRFASLPRPGRTLVTRWFWRGALQGLPRRKPRSVLVVARVFVEEASLPSGRYTCVLRAGDVVVKRVMFRIGS